MCLCLGTHQPTDPGTTLCKFNYPAYSVSKPANVMHTRMPFRFPSLSFAKNVPLPMSAGGVQFEHGDIMLKAINNTVSVEMLLTSPVLCSSIT